MPQRPSAYRSFVTCGDSEGVVNCGTVRKERRNMPKSLDMSSSRRGLREEGGVRNSRNSSSQLEEIEKGAQKLNKMIDSWASGISIDGELKDNIAKDLLRGALDLQDSLNMLSKLQEASLYMAKLKRLEKQDEKGRVSVDGLARSICVDEVKKVIRGSPVRQNFLPVSSMEPRWDRRGLSCASEGQSTSSGQSSDNFLKKVCSTDNTSVSSDNSDKNRKRTNLIAKLMGLDDRKLVQATTSSTSREMIHDEKRILPAFDFEMSKSNKPLVSTETKHQEKKTLRELLEATQPKGELESKFVDRLVPRTIPRRDDADKYPPIVLMKPLRMPYTELEKGQEQRFDASEIVKELNAKNWFSKVQDRVSERASLMRNEKTSTCTPQILTPETSNPHNSAGVKLQGTKTKLKEKTVVSMEQTSRANKSSKIVKSPDVNNNIKNVPKEKHASHTKLLVSKETPVSPLKSSNQDRNLSITKTQTSVPRQLTQTTTTSNFPKKASIDYSVDVKKTPKRKAKPVSQTLSGNALRHEDDATALDLSCQVMHVVPLPVNTKTTTEAAIEENWKDVKVMHDNSVQERSNKHFKDVSSENVTSNTSCLKSRSFRQSLLMSSPTIAASVEVLFHLIVSSTSSNDVTPSIHIDDDTTLFISYAKEVLERRSNHLLFSATSMSIPVSLNQLLQEVCDAYEAIDSYTDGITTVDIFDMLDRDIKCKEVVGSVWDLGWRNGHSAAETEKIVASLEKLILRDFIDEIFAHWKVGNRMITD